MGSPTGKPCAYLAQVLRRALPPSVAVLAQPALTPPQTAVNPSAVRDVLRANTMARLQLAVLLLLAVSCAGEILAMIALNPAVLPASSSQHPAARDMWLCFVSDAARRTCCV